jgi:hypothetical protein
VAPITPSALGAVFRVLDLGECNIAEALIDTDRSDKSTREATVTSE